jgi:hypothetical protein
LGQNGPIEISVEALQVFHPKFEGVHCWTDLSAAALGVPVFLGGVKGSIGGLDEGEGI